MSDSASIRAERRRQRILKNSDDRMKQIFGGQNYHDEHLKIDSNTNEDFVDGQLESLGISPNAQINGQLFESVQRSNEENLLQSLLLGQNEPKIDTNLSERKQLPFVRSTNATWILLGIATRVLLTNEFSWLLMDTALLSFFIIFISLEVLFPIQEQPNQIFTIIATLTGIDPNKIASITSIYCIIKRFINSFSIYFVSFVVTEIIYSFL